MNYVAVDTASKVLKVLVECNGKREYFESADFKTASTSLMPELDACLKRMGASLAEMDFYACVIGPGSFTGIRIGMATVKAFAYAFNKPVVAVTSLQLLAYNSVGEDTVIAVTDASNGMRYLAVYDDKMNELLPPICMSKEELAEFLKTVDEPYGIYSDEVLAEEVNGKTPQSFENAFVRAVIANSACLIDGNVLEPIYIRKPQAERDLELKNGKTGN